MVRCFERKNSRKMKAVINKYQNWILWIVCAGLVFGGGIYYFGVYSAVMPNAEDLATTQQWYQILHLGQPYRHSNIILDLTGWLSGLVGGMSYFACRLRFALLYAIISGLSLWLCISKREPRKRWAVLPLWAFFMVFVHTVHSEQIFGRLYESEDWIIQFPYHYHTAPLIFALICTILLQSYLNAEKGKKKAVTGWVGLLTVIYAFLFTDIIYYIVFALPFLIVLVLRGFYHEKTKKYMMPLLCIGVGMILLTRILPGALSERLWRRESMYLYGEIYGAANWLDLDNVLSCLANYIKTVMQLFNIELSNYPVISLYSILFVVRTAFVVMGYGIVGKIIVCSLKGKSDQSGYTMIDELLAWAFVLLSCSFLFTGNGVKSDATRFYGGLVPLLVILLCRNVENAVKSFLPALGSMKYKRFYFAGIIGALCICQAEPVWRYHAEDSYQEDCEEVIEWLRQWGAESDGYALAPFWLCSRLSAAADGDILFYCNEESLRAIHGEDAAVRYAVVGWDERGILPWDYELIKGYGSYDEWSESGTCSIKRAVDLDHVYVCEFE